MNDTMPTWADLDARLLEALQLPWPLTARLQAPLYVSLRAADSAALAAHQDGNQELEQAHAEVGLALVDALLALYRAETLED